MGRKIGYQAKLYRNTGDYATPVWKEIALIGDLNHDSSHAEADATTRGDGGEEVMLAALTSRSLNFELRYDEADLDVIALEDSYYDKTPIEFAVMSGDIAVAGSRGFRATMQIFGWNKTENLNDPQNVSVTAKPTAAENPPSKMVV